MPLSRKSGLDLKLTSTSSMHESLTANQKEQTHGQRTIRGDEQGEGRGSRVGAAAGTWGYQRATATSFDSDCGRPAPSRQQQQVLLQCKSAHSRRTRAAPACDGKTDHSPKGDCGDATRLRVSIQSVGCFCCRAGGVGDDGRKVLP